MVTLSNIVSAFRTYFGISPKASPALTEPTLPVFKYRLTQMRMTNRGSRHYFVGGGTIPAANAPSAALALARLRRAYPGEVVEIDGNRYRVWTTENGPSVSLIDPARRAVSGDRRRHRESLAR